MKTDDLLDVLCNRNIISLEDIDRNAINFLYGFSTLEVQTNSDILTILFANYQTLMDSSEEEKVGRKKNIVKLRDELIESDNVFNLYFFFDDWNQQRRVLHSLESVARNAKEKKAINEVFDSMIPIYLAVPETLFLKVDEDGVNYLEQNTDGKDKKYFLNSKVFNVSMYELKELYNVSGKHLFKQNVRVGIEDKKPGKDLKEEFKNYLKVGLINLSGNEALREKLKEYFSELAEPDYLKFNPNLFWFKHNGVNIFIEENSVFKSESDAIVINPQKVSVINGAQTLTNFFLAEEELFEELKGSDIEFDKLKEDFIKVLKNISVKTIFIQGTANLSKTITWGLNNQIPISDADFIGISSVVKDLNDRLKKYQLKILKTGEMERIYTGLTPLDFVKLFLIAKEQPGRSKNFNKDGMAKNLEDALKESDTNPVILKKIDIALDIEKWWKNYYRLQKDKTPFLRYGRSYFQSYVIHILEQEDQIDSFLIGDLESYYINLDKIIEINDANINDFKSDSLFNRIIQQISLESNKVSNHFKDDESLTNYLINHVDNNYSVSAKIREYNDLYNIDLPYFRTVSVMNDNIKESFPLPNSTFEEFYKRDNYMVDDNYPEFESSLFVKEIKRNYPIYVVKYDEERNIVSVNLISDFSLTKSDDWEANAKKAFDKVREAFIEGNISGLPKLSDNIKFHVRPKAMNGNDTFTFSNGQDITRRTFWANASYIKEILGMENIDLNK